MAASDATLPAARARSAAMAVTLWAALLPCSAPAQPAHKSANININTNTNTNTHANVGALENRCGWFHNPTPGNATLTDRDGEWEVSTQGGFSAEGDWPEFTDTQWTQTNGHYGYGCACMKVVVDRSERRVLRMASATAKSLKVCRADKALATP